MVTFECPKCGRPEIVKDELAGGNIRCPTCKEWVAVPNPAVFEAAVKPCPMCGESILAVAKKCKHCGEYLDRSAPPSISPGIAALISLIIPGGGQIAVGYVFMGLGALLLTAILYVIFPPIGVLGHIACIVNAYLLAQPDHR